VHTPKGAGYVLGMYMLTVLQNHSYIMLCVIYVIFVCCVP
jgi:hypothetical protein